MARGKPFDQLSPKYRRRIERAMARGKTRQQARGHKEREHIERREREREESGGLSRYENDAIRRWYDRFNPREGEGKPDVETIVDEASQRGYDWFVKYRNAWEAMWRGYRGQLRRGTWASKGEGFLEAMAAELDLPEISWLYYH